MSITSVSTTTDSTGSVTSSAGTILGKDDFLTILVAQLENQDPLDPQDSTEFIGQMTQCSALEQQIQTNENLETLSSSVGSMEQYAAFQLLGTEIVASSDGFSFSGEAVELGFGLEEGVDDLELFVMDADGAVVASLDAGPAEAGSTFVSWDGSDDSGAQVACGDYTFAVRAADESDIEATLLVRGTVRQVSLEESGSVLSTGAGVFALSDVTDVFAN
jgi:flagellar basal-body rod modification protein FlgD